MSGRRCKQTVPIYKTDYGIELDEHPDSAVQYFHDASQRQRDREDEDGAWEPTLSTTQSTTQDDDDDNERPLSQEVNELGVDAIDMLSRDADGKLTEEAKEREFTAIAQAAQEDDASMSEDSWHEASDDDDLAMDVEVGGLPNPLRQLGNGKLTLDKFRRLLLSRQELRNRRQNGFPVSIWITMVEVLYDLDHVTCDAVWAFSAKHWHEIANREITLQFAKTMYGKALLEWDDIMQERRG